MILKKVKNEIGATAIEYGLIASLVAVVAVGGMSAVGVKLSNTYCTISKSLGGSEKCSGSGLSGTGGNGSSTGSGNSNTGNGGNNSTIPTSVTTEEDMNNLENSLKDEFDPSFLDGSLGGKNEYLEDGVIQHGEASSYLNAMNNYNNNPENSNNQITHVFGLYEGSNKQPITSFTKASQGLNLEKSDIGSVYTGKNNEYSLEVTTQQGNVYKLSDGGKMTPQLIKGS